MADSITIAGVVLALAPRPVDPAALAPFLADPPDRGTLASLIAEDPTAIPAIRALYPADPQPIPEAE